jgi:hypothetical protein
MCEFNENDDFFIPNSFSNFSPQAKLTFVNAMRNEKDQSLPSYFNSNPNGDGSYNYISNDGKYAYNVRESTNGSIIIDKSPADALHGWTFRSSSNEPEPQKEIEYKVDEKEVGGKLGWEYDFAAVKHEANYTFINKEDGSGWHVTNELKIDDIKFSIGTTTGAGADIVNDKISVNHFSSPVVSVNSNDLSGFSVSQSEKGLSISGSVGADINIDFSKLDFTKGPLEIFRDFKKLFSDAQFKPGESVSFSNVHLQNSSNLDEFKQLSEHDILLLERDAIYNELEKYNNAGSDDVSKILLEQKLDDVNSMISDAGSARSIQQPSDIFSYKNGVESGKDQFTKNENSDIGRVNSSLPFSNVGAPTERERNGYGESTSTIFHFETYYRSIEQGIQKLQNNLSHA